jgi:glutamate-1-semialdehyde aminotransferase
VRSYLRQSATGTPSRRASQPVPLVFERGAGARLYDMDGNVYLDYALGMGPNILGHAPRRSSALSPTAYNLEAQ